MKGGLAIQFGESLLNNSFLIQVFLTFGIYRLKRSNFATKPKNAKKVLRKLELLRREKGFVGISLYDGSRAGRWGSGVFLLSF